MFWRLLSPVLHRALLSNRAPVAGSAAAFHLLCHKCHMESAVLLTQTNERLINPCSYHPVSYTALCDILQMRENGKGRFSLKSLQIPSRLAAAEMAAHSSVQAAELPTSPEERFFGYLSSGLNSGFETMNLGLLASFLLNLPPLKQIV